MLNFDKTDLIEGGLLIINDDGIPTFIPEERASIEEQALFAEFRAKYPNGKPVIPVEPQTPVPTELEILQAQLKASQEYASILNDNLQQFMEYIVTNVPNLP